MTYKLATLSHEGDVSIITLDDGKANVFSEEMTQAFNDCLDKVPTETGSLIITGRPGMFSAGFDLKVIASGDILKIKAMSVSGFKLLSRIFSLLSMIFPVTFCFACISKIRLKVRNKVVFPDPDGPINVVVEFFSKRVLISCKA